MPDVAAVRLGGAPSSSPVSAGPPGTRSRAWALVPRVDAPVLGVGGTDSLPSPHVLAGAGNPDGMHWRWSGPATVGRGPVALLEPALPADGTPTDVK